MLNDMRYTPARLAQPVVARERCQVSCVPNVVLVVDDEAPIRRLLEAALNGWGYSVNLAESGAAALSMLCQQAYAVIVTDIQMPQMDGVSLWRSAVERGCSGAWIMMTGSASPPALGTLPILHKPFRLGALHDLLKDVATR